MNTFDEIIQTKAYSDLNSNELEIIRELVSSEEEYNEMKSFYAEIDQLAISGREEVSVSVKSSLNSVFQAKHPGISQNWSAPAEVEEKKIIPLYNRTIFRAAALLVLSAGVITIWVSMSDNSMEKGIHAELTAKTDTILSEEQKVEPKKEFPLNDAEKQKDFTAASEVPKDENADQSVTFYSNATTASGNSYTISSGSGNSGWSLPGKTQNGSVSTFKSTNPALTPSIASGAQTFSLSSSSETPTYYFSSPKPSKKVSSDKAKNSGFVASDTDDKDSFTKAGLNADLNPGGYVSDASASTRDYKPSIQTTDLLTLIEPSF
ncbi:MAG: hypothetical protein ACO1N0_11645 [Fluviicola sp.]